MSDKNYIVFSTPEAKTPVVNDDSLTTNGSLSFFENPLSNAVCRIPTNPTPLSWDKSEVKKIVDGNEEIFEIDIKCLRRGNIQLSMFEGVDEIVLSDNSKKLFIGLLKGCFEYYQNYGRDVENLRVKLSPKDTAPLLNITLSDNPDTRKNQLKEARKSLKKFETEISKIRIIGSYSYWKKGKKETLQFDGGILNENSFVRKLDESGKVISEGYSVNPDFYYSLVNCYHIMRIPFTAFAVSGKNAFSIIFDLYARSRENGGKQEIKTKNLLEHIGFTERKNWNFSRDIKNRVVDTLRNSLGQAIKNFEFISSTNGEPLDLETCSYSDWENSVLKWEQFIPSETETLLEHKVALENKSRARAPKRKSPKLRK